MVRLRLRDTPVGAEKEEFVAAPRPRQPCSRSIPAATTRLPSPDDAAQLRGPHIARVRVVARLDHLWRGRCAARLTIVAALGVALAASAHADFAAGLAAYERGA
jgi:hypothetical protein